MSLDYEDREFITPAAWQKGELPHIPTVVRNKVSAKRIDRKIRVVCRASHSQNDPGSLDNNGGDVLNAVDGQTAVPTQKGSRYTFIDIEKDLQMFDVEYDFDAEDEPDVIPPPPLKLSRNQKAYVDACQLLRVAPCKMILKTIDGEAITIRNRALGSHGLKALCVALVSRVGGW
ncbi:uncharacterized protein LOC112042325 [Lingula anatina]|uniref:Uncharacterized protein LOC112042325 n=1 Tax=Lingula anatina TaxID=7574 RepID=A0A2R2MQF4_LINAN|nr:uncharacterized protein LOC112042325 [Lingula anatina]|eukprot:XP_023932476.1 uncharacterized protein LOC112042325 [Lingula anatina]